MDEDEQDDFADIYSTIPAPSSNSIAVDGIQSNKRKHDVDDYELDDTDDFYPDKRQKTVSPTNKPNPPPRTRAHLSPEIWQNILQYLSPKTLARALRVSRMFYSCLMSGNPPDVKTHSTGACRPVPSNEIWKTSRHVYYPSLPQESPACGERAIWALFGTKDCQFCGKMATATLKGRDPWAAGPGADGVSIIWPFGVRSCAPCLRQRVQSDSSLMVSDYVILLAAAPFAFITATDHIITSATFRSGAETQARAEVNKVFYMPMLVEMQSALQVAQTGRPQAASELYSKMRAERPQRLESAESWSVWEADGGLHQLRARLLNPEIIPATPRRQRQTISTPPSATNVMNNDEEQTSSAPYSPQLSESSTRRPMTMASDSHSTSTFTQYAGSRSAPPRNVTSVKAAKVIRRAEIERRCKALDPPITPELLNHMDSFQAAMQIGAPLNDNGWNMLKPRLVAQREIAQQRENERQAILEAARADAEGYDAGSLDTQQLKDRTDILQKPLRTRLSGYVDEIVRTSWADGRAINVETSPRFASDALVYVRNRFASDIPKFTSVGTTDSKLVLENMKWIYDNKIKPLAEPYRRDLFLCAGCGDNTKYFAFDSIIQHYAAKHTSTYSSGTIVVAWQEAVWPEQPPFQTFPDPDSRRKDQQTPFPKQQAIAPQPQGPLHGPKPIHAHTPGFYSGHMMSPPPFGHAYGPYASPDRSYSQQPLQSTVSPAYQQQSGYMPPGHYGPTSPIDPRGFFQAPSPHTPASAYVGWGAPSFPSHPPTYAPSPTQGAPTFLQMQSDAVANIAREVWDALFIVKQIHPSVRMYVLIHRVVSRFQTRFSNEPNLDLFTQCLITHHLMRPMKDANGLACKTCVVNNESHEESHTQAFHLSSGERKLYPFHSLLLHFKNVHVEHALALKNAQTHEVAENLQRLDWKEDMIELPEEHIIANYRTAPSMDRAKFEILREAFPNLPEFVEQDIARTSMMPFPIHGAGHVRNMSAGYPASSPVYGYQPMDISPTTNERFIKLEPGNFAATAGQRYSPSHGDNVPQPRDNEYDPQRPAFIDSRLPPAHRDQGGRPSYHQPSFGAHPSHGTIDHRSAPSRQSYDRHSPPVRALSPTQSAADPALTALLQNLTAQQQKQYNPNPADSGSQHAKEQADTFLRDFIPLSEAQDHGRPQQGQIMQPPSMYATQRPMYEHGPSQESYHGQAPRRTSSFAGSHDDNRPTYVGPEMQQRQDQAQYAQYPEEHVEYVYVRRQDPGPYQQQPFQGYR